MAAVSRLVAELDLDASGYDKELAHVKKQTSGLKKFFGTALATAGGFLAANVIGKGFDLITDNIGSTITAASDLNETVSKTNAIFGDSADAMLDWGDAAFRMGLSKTQALDAASQFGGMAKSAGLAGDEVNKFAQTAVSAAADLGSFFNVPVEQALEDIRSGLAGEAEPLRKYNIFLNEAAVNAKAMEMGLVGANGEVTEAAKIQARYALILEQMGDAQGDQARTAGSLANQTKILSAQLTNLRASIGQKLLPTVVKITNAANRFLTRFDKKRMAGIPILQSLLSSLHTTLNQTFGRETGTKIYNTVRAIIDGIKVAAQVVKTAVAVIVDVVRGLISVFQWAQTHFPNFFAALEQTVRQTIVVIQDVVALIDAIADGDWARAWETFKTLAEDTVQLMIDRLMTIPALLKDIFNLAFAAIRDVDWGAVADFLLAQGVRLIAALYDAARDYFTGTVVPWLRGLPGDILAAMPSLVATLVGHGMDLLQGLYDGITGPVWGAVKDFFGKLPGRIAGFLPNDIGTRLAGAGRSLLRGFRDGIVEVWETVIAPWFGGIGFTILGAVPSLSTVLWQRGRNLLRGLLNGIKDVWREVRGFFGGIDDAIKDILPSQADFEAVFDVITAPLKALKTLAEGVVDVLGKVAGWFGKGGGKDKPDDIGGGEAVEVGSFEGTQALKDIQTWTGEVAAAFALVEPYLIFVTGEGGAVGETKSMQAPPFNGEGALAAVKRFAKDVTQQFKTLNLATAEQMRAMKANADIQFAAIATTATTRAFSLRNGVVNQFIGMRTDTVSIATSMKTQVVGQFASMYAQAGGAGEGKTNALKMSVINAFNTMEASAIASASSIKFGVVGQFSSMLSGVRSIMGQVSGAVSGGIYGARDAANAAASSFYFVGQNIAVGIRNGIRDTAGIIAAEAANAVNNAINAANAAAQVSSPSRRTMYTGAMIAEGMAVGINRGVPSVKSAGSRLANAAFVVPGSASAGAYGGGGARGGIVNYGTIGIEDPDPRKIRDATHAMMVGLARS
jgi:hypothetical protein